MKRISRILGVFLCLFLAFSGTAHAASDAVIDVSNSSEGYFSVNYTESTDTRMKVGVKYGGNTEYYDYKPGSEVTYSFTEGDGSYTITLYSNISGTTYRPVTSANVSVNLENEFAPYLISTTEVTFSEGDEITKKADSLCSGLSDDASKIVAIHNFIAGNFKYDYAFAARVRRGIVKSYIPNTAELMNTQRGVCYDFTAVFAAMCRSQDIPCAVAKGYIDAGYHAWNMVYVDDSWSAVDLTDSITSGVQQVAALSECTSSMNNYRDYSY